MGSNKNMITSEQYRLLFNALSDTILTMEQLVGRLKTAQEEAEELCIREGLVLNDPIVFAPPQQEIRAVE